MDPKKRNQLKQLQLSLKRNGFGLYCRILCRLFEVHDGYDFLKPLQASLRSRDFLKLYTEADSLSSQSYEDATEHFVANQFALMLKKFPWPKSVLDLKPEERAYTAFMSSEKRCDLVNRKFKILSWNRSRDRKSKEAGAAKHWIRTVIGSRPNYRRCFDKSDFGPGASVGVHGDATSYAAKLSAECWTVTPGALHHGYAAVRRNFHIWESLLPRRGPYVCYDEEAGFQAYLRKISVVQENKICFVPKTAKTDRTIAVEPLLNGFVQKGVDQLLRENLKAVGLNLSDQGLNQRFACEGSIDDSDDGFVTIDMKSASDSISTELVRFLIPDDWFRLLDRIRSKYYRIYDDAKPFKKFCSMGNGFCFPLETLIFASACIAVGAGVPSKDFIVYGDDIIVRKRYASPLIDLLGHWGFKVNSDKTFLSGPFRESCGTDWFGGKDVRPFTLDYGLDSIQTLFKYLNLTRRSEICESFFQETREMAVKPLPEQFRFFRPFEGQEDTGIDSQGSEFMTVPSCVYVPKYNKWVWHEFSSEPVVDFDTIDKLKDQPWLISDALRGSSSVNFGLHKGLPKVTLRNRTQTKIVRKGYVSTSNWLPPPQPVVIPGG